MLQEIVMLLCNADPHHSLNLQIFFFKITDDILTQCLPPESREDPGEGLGVGGGGQQGRADVIQMDL